MNLLFLSVNSNTDRYVEEINDNLSKYRIKFNSWKYDGKTLFLNSGKKKTIPCISFNYLNNLSNTDLLFNRSRIREMINSCKEEIKELKITHLVTFNDFYGLNYIMIKLCVWRCSL